MHVFVGLTLQRCKTDEHVVLHHMIMISLKVLRAWFSNRIPLILASTFYQLDSPLATIFGHLGSPTTRRTRDLIY